MEKKLQCIIVDDDPEAINMLSALVHDQKELILQKSYTDPLVALSDILLQKEAIDIAFLDIDLPVLSGLQLAKRIQGKVNFIVFVTAFAEYSLAAYRVNAMQYLIKPVKMIDLVDIVIQINQLRFPNLSADVWVNDQPDDGIYVLAGVKGQYIRLEIANIILFSAEKNQIHIYTNTVNYLANAGINKVMADLHDDPRFMRIHKSHIIRLSAIKNISSNLVYLDQDYRAPVSPQYRNAFFNHIQQRILKNRS